MDFESDYYLGKDSYKSYGSFDEVGESFNPDDCESDYWEDILPDDEQLALEFERHLEEQTYSYDDPYFKEVEEEPDETSIQFSADYDKFLRKEEEYY